MKNGTIYYPLFEILSDNYGINALETELEELVCVAEEIRTAQKLSEATEAAGYIDVAFDKFIEFPDSKNMEFVTATSAKLFAEFWAESRKSDMAISLVCDFVGAYEKEKFRIMHEGGKLLSVNQFMVDYCHKLRKEI